MAQCKPRPTIGKLFNWAKKNGLFPAYSPCDEFGPVDNGDKYYAVDGFPFGDDDNMEDGPMVHGCNDATLYNDGSYGYALACGTIYGDHKDLDFMKSLMLTYRDKGLKAAIEFARESGDKVAVPLPELGIEPD